MYENMGLMFARCLSECSLYDALFCLYQRHKNVHNFRILCSGVIQTAVIIKYDVIRKTRSKRLYNLLTGLYQKFLLFFRKHKNVTQISYWSESWDIKTPNFNFFFFEKFDPNFCVTNYFVCTINAKIYATIKLSFAKHFQRTSFDRFDFWLSLCWIRMDGVSCYVLIHALY